MAARRQKNESDDNAADGRGRPSKSAAKREMAAAGALVLELIGLNGQELGQLGIEPELASEILNAAMLKGGAQRRQIKYVTAAVAALDVAVLSAQLQQLQQPQRDEIQRFHRYEQWRDKLIAGDAALVQQLGQRFGHAWADVSNLIDQARAGKAGASRALFRSLAELDRKSDNS